MKVKIKRIYEPYSANDGFRILTDRLWPRGIKKEQAHIDVWMKEIAPSTTLRKWFNHEVDKWEEFRIKYHHELSHSVALADLTAYLHQHKTITLLFAAKDEKHNHALVLQQFMADRS